MTGKPFESAEDIFLVHKGHFAVDLGEFGLPVGPEVFIPETFYNLKIAVISGNHQKLLENLRTLRQGVELMRIHTGRNYEIAGTFRSGFDKHWRLNFNKLLIIKIFTSFLSHFMSQ